jgi:FSR family fosmidomycin resistance protein-like MFS transporter
MPSYGLVLAAVVVCGLGVASFHPESFKSILASAGERKVTAVSWFMVGGNTGMALGPLILTACVAWLGLKGTVLFSLPAWIMAGVLWLNWGLLKDGGKAAGSSAAAPAPQPLGERWRPLSLLLLTVTLRSWAQFGISSYLPFYFLRELGGDPLLVGHLLTTYLFCGAAGTIAGGPLADRVGPKTFFIVSVALVTPVMASFLYADAFWLFVAAGLAGALLMATWSTVMVMAQQILPDRAGMASGLMVGFALGAGGMGATALGWVADTWGLPMVLKISAALPALSALIAWWLPGRPHTPAGVPKD